MSAGVLCGGTLGGIPVCPGWDPIAAVSLSPVREQTDDLLVNRAQAGDRKAFDELVRKYSVRLYGLMVGLLGPGAEAEEALQETFLRAWKSIESFRGDSQFYTWLYRIGVNEANRVGQRITRHRSRAEYSLDNDSERPRAAEGPEPDRSAHISELRHGLFDALAALPAEQRAAIVLRDVNGISTEESAEICGIKEAAFKSRLHRARMQVRSAISRLVEDD